MSGGANYEEKFASRFGQEDAEFQQYVKRAPEEPPLVEDWRAQGRRERRDPGTWQHRGHHDQDRRYRSDRPTSGHSDSHYRRL